MNHINEFRQLADSTLQKIKDFGIISRSILKRFNYCIRLLSEHLILHNSEFNQDTGFQWLEGYEFNKSNTPEVNRNLWLSFRRTIMLLLDNKSGNLTEWKAYPIKKAKYPETQKFINILCEYEIYLKQFDFAMATIDFRIRCAKEILIFFEKIQICTLDSIDNKIIADYFITERFRNRKPAGVKAEMARIKLFLEYLDENELVSNKLLSYAVPRYHIQELKIITTITPLAKEQILMEQPNLLTDKRERAMYLLALHLGLRTCDILALKFVDIDWNTGKLSIRQQKTKVSIKIKIDNDTQNAIIDYILNERRQSQDDHIFITSKGPINRLNNGVGNTHRRINGIDIKKNIPHQGLHIMRRTFASNLLRNGTPLSVISSALGHVNKEEVHHYLSTDEKKLKQCALNLDTIIFRRSEF